MDLLREFYCKPDLPQAGKTIYREAVRGIICQGGRLLLVYSPVNGDYKFPGGGVGEGEAYHAALAREIREECGAELACIVAEFGRVIEYDRPQEPEFDLFKMTSMYYQCSIRPGMGATNLDEYERDLGFQSCWVTLVDAIENNRAVLQSGRANIPRWTTRDTYIMELIQQRGLAEIDPVV